MPLQNRVTPHGDIEFSKSKNGTLMGNRGNLHNDKQEIRRKTKIKGWVACSLEFQGISRKPLMQPGLYTELFFLDEATAFSAGHRPCKTCQKERFISFKKVWLSVNQSKYQIKGTNITEVDEVLHTERISEDGSKVTHQAIVAHLPDGAFIDISGKYYLIWKAKLLEWSFYGYVSAINIPQDQEVTVLTPKSVLSCFEAGFAPEVHESALKFCSEPSQYGTRPFYC